ncbi:hypothetical protein SAMN05660909_01813 [Chitinophaga terrae (ex Kim and Jung 2007)]|jgi:hypothetical protein|uniref:Uncharacterized protein n=1 Tax=Chitinophaga terrae (ex Kim and Jung 2007) TaxID=408074 RepID=A0A1H4AWP5_9BACT|nr:hypothetical protein [Chitinophaga terrae (ex Kim and Jung 2007)]GEP89098.1 hypothetical protein CTE07_07430 [Chitinophaga terrae (ex Kim and Jung 2007)]SEA40309.1 hypothetical protein SAMN05660909_01813 [Chitinophaga terrae (ex Kim and Jung 2007)]
MSEYPKEIALFQQTLGSLKGIENVCSGIDNLDGITADVLGSPELAHLPVATLRRTNGGLPNEVMLQFEFTIDRSADSLQSLEFLSWFFRDQARSGERLQLRTFALPPQTPNGIQLGQTLKFHIDYFIEDAPDTLQPILDRIAKINGSLETFIKIYSQNIQLTR